MVILHIQLNNLAANKSKGNAPVAGDLNTPSSRAVAHQLVDPPTWRTLNARYIGSRYQHSQNISRSINKVTTNFPRIIVLDKTPQATVFDGSDVHRVICTV